MHRPIWLPLLLASTCFLATPALADTSATPSATGSTAITASIFKDKGCVQCHKVTAYDVDGGETGPDLSLAYSDVKDRFGTTLDKFLAAPTGTMQMVLGSMIKLSPAERKGIYQLLKEAHTRSKAAK